MDYDTIKFLVEKSRYPLVKGRMIKSRKVLEIGKNYYWKLPIISDNDIPLGFKDFVRVNELSDYNSVLINVYQYKHNHIGWHCDKIDKLVDGKVISYSFAINSNDNDKLLSVMEFSSDEYYKKIKLYNGTRVEFNAINDFKNNIKHCVSKTYYPRINITFRKIN